MILAALFLIVGPDAVVDEPGYGHDCAAQPVQNFELRLTPSDISSAQIGAHHQSNEPVLNIQFSPSGQDRFLAVQKGRIGKKIAICFEGKLLSTPILQDYIYGGRAQISGFTLDELTDFQARMNETKTAP